MITHIEYNRHISRADDQDDHIADLLFVYFVSQGGFIIPLTSADRVLQHPPAQESVQVVLSSTPAIEQSHRNFGEVLLAFKQNRYATVGVSALLLKHRRITHLHCPMQLSNECGPTTEHRLHCWEAPRTLFASKNLKTFTTSIMTVPALRQIQASKETTTTFGTSSMDTRT